MSAINQPARHVSRALQTNIRDTSKPGDLKFKADGLVATAPASGNSEGLLLRALDSSSRRHAVLQQEKPDQAVDQSSTHSHNTSSSTLDSASQAVVAVKTSIATDSSGIEASNAAVANDSSGLEAAKSAMQDNLKQMASDPKAFHEAMKKSFGENYDQSKAESIRQQVLNDDFSWMPEIRVVDESVLLDQSGMQGAGQAFGAYSGENDTIYISQQLLDSDPAKATQILTEEIGHALDARLNTSDAAGDEGDIFARLVGGEEITDTQLSALRAENDSGTIIVDGKEVEVEYGFFKKLVKSVTKPFKKIGKAIKKGLSKAWKGIKKGFKKLMQSRIFNAILMVAQFIPIPVVQVAVRVINAVKAAYQVYQGAKHGSIGMILGGVAGVAGGIGGAGKLLGASTKFVETAGKIANGARTAGAAYQAISKGNFAAAAGLASNYFGGSGTDLGRTLGAAGQVASAVDKAKDGDIFGAIQSGQAAYSGFSNVNAGNRGSTQDSGGANGSSSVQSSGIQGFIDNIKGNDTYLAIVENVSTIRNIVKAVKDGNYSSATSTFLTNYADDLGIGQSSQDTIKKWAGVIEKVNDTKELLQDGKYSTAIGEAAGLLGIPLTENNQNRLDTVFKIRDSVLGSQYATASRQAASLALQSGNPELAANFLRLSNLLDGKLPLPVSQRSVSDAA